MREVNIPLIQQAHSKPSLSIEEERRQAEALYQQCCVREAECTRDRFKKIEKVITERLALDLFDAPFYVTETDPNPTVQAIHRGNKYRDLLALLRRAQDNHVRLLTLAWWLKCEGICDPVDFLPKALVSKLRRAARKRLRGRSFTDLYYSALVEIWWPYFVRLKGDHERFQKYRRTRDELVKRGYSTDAIDILVSPMRPKRSVLQAVFEWVAGHLKCNVPKIRNAYSRVKTRGKSRLRVSQSS
jgi:hypothetical protein